MSSIFEILTNHIKNLKHITIAAKNMANKISPKELAERKDDYVILDVREPDEVNEDGKIETAANIPLGQLKRKARHGDVDDLKGKKICTYCSGWYRGNIAAEDQQP